MLGDPSHFYKRILLFNIKRSRFYWDLFMLKHIGVSPDFDGKFKSRNEFFSFGMTGCDFE